MAADNKSLELVKKLVADNPVMVFSKSYCPYCTKAKKALTEHKAKFEVIELDEREDGSAIQDALKELTGQRSVPNVFISQKSIGGGDDTVRLAKSGELDKLLVAAKAVKA